MNNSALFFSIFYILHASTSFRLDSFRDAEPSIVPFPSWNPNFRHEIIRNRRYWTNVCVCSYILFCAIAIQFGCSSDVLLFGIWMGDLNFVFRVVLRPYFSKFPNFLLFVTLVINIHCNTTFIHHLDGFEPQQIFYSENLLNRAAAQLTRPAKQNKLQVCPVDLSIICQNCNSGLSVFGIVTVRTIRRFKKTYFRAKSTVVRVTTNTDRNTSSE